MEGPAPLSGLEGGGVDWLTSRIVTANMQGLVVRGFYGSMCARVWYMAERAFIRWGVSIPYG